MKRKCLIGTMLALLVMSLYVNMACAESFDDFLKEKYEDYKKDFQKLQKEHPEEYPFSLLKSYDMWQQEHYANGDITKWMEQWQRDHPDDDDWKKKFESGDKEPESDDKKPSDTLWAQEPSQIATALLILSEMFTLQRIVSDQEKMLKRIDDDKTKYNAIVNSRQKILDGI